jgi:hypothetical protein
MPPNPSLKCLHCNRLFVPDYRHRRDQRYCAKPACKRARHSASLVQWRNKAENKDYWSGSWNVDRVREWRAANPEYWKRTGRKSERPLQNAMKPTEVTAPPMNKQESSGACVTRRVPALLQAQSPVVLGLIAQITGSALQDAILEVTTRLFENGQAVLGISTPGKNEERAKQIPSVRRRQRQPRRSNRNHSK